MPKTYKSYPKRHKNFTRKKGTRKGNFIRPYLKKHGPTYVKVQTPLKQYVRLKYSFNYLFDTAGTNSDYILNANNCYDPDRSLGGGQPAYFDQWAALYEDYSVRGAKLTVKAIPTEPDEGDGKNYRITIIPMRDRNAWAGGASATYNYYKEQPFAKERITKSDGTCTVLSKYMSTNHILGKKLSEFDTASLVSADPPATCDWQWHFYVQSLDGVASVKLLVEFTLEQWVCFSTRHLAVKDA